MPGPPFPLPGLDSIVPRMLEIITDGVWAKRAAMSFMGMRLGTRMTVLRLGSGELLVYSAVPLGDGIAEAVDALGDVAHIVAPNTYHHMHAGAAKSRYPDALLHGGTALQKKRRDLAFGGSLPDSLADLRDDVVPLTVTGWMLDETILFHEKSGTLVCADLLENFYSMDHFVTRSYLKMAGIWERPGVSRPLRPLYRDKKGARRSIDAILELPFERVVLAHGDPILENGRDALREAYSWLS